MSIGAREILHLHFYRSTGPEHDLPHKQQAAIDERRHIAVFLVDDGLDDAVVEVPCCVQVRTPAWTRGCWIGRSYGGASPSEPLRLWPAPSCRPLPAPSLCSSSRDFWCSSSESLSVLPQGPVSHQGGWDNPEGLRPAYLRARLVAVAIGVGLISGLLANAGEFLLVACNHALSRFRASRPPVGYQSRPLRDNDYELCIGRLLVYALCVCWYMFSVRNQC